MRTLIVIFGFVLLSTKLCAQISPGELSTPHADFEGMNKCTLCHELGQKINGQKCLDCHTEIQTRVSQQRGYHGSSSVRNQECADCHHDHKGRNFDMIKWDGGQSGFHHDLTGYKLEGKHKATKCEACHRSQHIKDNSVLNRVSDGLNLSKTFLGLDRECRRCHFDEHRQQFSQSCADCHDFEEWKNSAGIKFKHSEARFLLAGKHAQVACVQCHPAVNDPRKMPNGATDNEYLQFKGIGFEKCTDCHKDPHRNQFGQVCEKCHTPANWNEVKTSGFDHSKTKYPLTGKHLTVACNSCHQPDVKKKAIFNGLAHEECRTCHQDAHAGQLAGRADKGRCEACHTTKGFIPPLYTFDQHKQTKFALAGGHSAVACNQCHSKLSKDEFLKRTGLPYRTGLSATLFRFASLRCTNCHEDAHRGQFKERVDKEGCEGCHQTDSWNKLAFDHNKDSKFPLRGKHKDISCYRCHKVEGQSASKALAGFKGVPTFCESCHADIHYGQFAVNSELNSEHPRTKCDGCHGEEGFKPSKFDHNTRSRFTLSGAHEKVACNKCHKPVRLRNGAVTVVYKPIEIKCSSCHENLK